MKKYLVLVFIWLNAFLTLRAQSVEDLSDAHKDQILITDANYIDVVTGKTYQHQSILIQDGIITKIQESIAISDKMKVIDASDQWIIPGLIDAHIHLFQSGGLYTRPDAIDLTAEKPYHLEIEWLKDNASTILKSYLKNGITTVIDVGGPMYNYKIRELYGSRPDHPNIFLTGPLISTYQPAAFQIEDPPIIKTNTPEEARELVRMQLPYQPDFIKIWYIVTQELSAESTFEIVKAAIDESHLHGLNVAVHATQLKTAKLAIEAGADVLVHSVSDPVDNEFIKLLLDNEIIYIPTLVVHGNYNLAFLDRMNLGEKELNIVSPEVIGSLLDVKHLDHEDLKQVKQFENQLLERDLRHDKIRKTNLKRLAEAGVTIATGTDAGNIGTLHAASYFDEIESMFQAGLSNLEILQASTYGAAHVVKKQDSLGRIAMGMKGDLLILSENPLVDLNAIRSIKYVIQNGRVVNKGSHFIDTPSNLAQRQLNAYNLRDIEAFLEPYSDSVRVFSFPDKLLYTGKETMRTNYSTFFDRTPDLHCALINRIVIGNTVIDQEHVTGLMNGAEINAVAIYKIKNGKIEEVYFDRGE